VFSGWRLREWYLTVFGITIKSWWIMFPGMFFFVVHPREQHVCFKSCVCQSVSDSSTSLEIRRWWLFLIRTLTGLWTSSEDVPDAWSLSPSEPIFTFSWTIPMTHKQSNYTPGHCSGEGTKHEKKFFVCLFHDTSRSHPPLFSLWGNQNLLSSSDLNYSTKDSVPQCPNDGSYHQPC